MYKNFGTLVQSVTIIPLRDQTNGRCGSFGEGGAMRKGCGGAKEESESDYGSDGA